MNDSDREFERAWRAWANQQRRAREALIEATPSPLRDRLTHAPCTYSPNAHDFLVKLFPCSDTQLGQAATTELTDFRYTETGWYDKAISRIDEFCGRHAEDEVLLVLEDFSTIKLGGNVYLVPALPLFALSFDLACDLLRASLRPEATFRALFAADFRAGLVFEVFGEHCVDDRGPEERTFALATWGP